MLIDSHCHLLDERLNAEEEIARMPEDGLLAVVENGFDLSSSYRASALAEGHERVYCAVGCHPEEAGGFERGHIEEYLRLCALPKTVAVGEIGLDYYYEIAPREVQKKVFIAQLEMAHKAKKPVNLHIRDAYGDAFDIMKECKELLGSGAEPSGKNLGEEELAIRKALEANRYHKGRAAEELGISRTTLWKKMKSLGLG